MLKNAPQYYYILNQVTLPVLLEDNLIEWAHWKIRGVIQVTYTYSV